MSYENHRHPAQRETGQRGGRKTQGSPGTPPFRPLAQPLAGLHCRVPGVVAYPSGVALLQRIKNLSAELIEKNRYLKESDILRELVGLENTGIITQAIRQKLLPVQPSDELEPIGEGSPNKNN